MGPEARLPESSVVVRPEPMESATYTQSSRLQAAGLLPAVTLFEQAAAEVPLPAPPQPVVIADYGAATGHNSLKPMSAAIDVLRRRTRHDHAILVAHSDVPDNDFTALFRTLNDDPRQLPAPGSGEFRLGHRPILLLPNHADRHREPGLDVVGDPVAEPNPERSPRTQRSRFGRIQQDRGRPRGLRAAGRRRTGRTSWRSADARCVPTGVWWC